MKKHTINHWTAAEDRLIVELAKNGQNPIECEELRAKHTGDAIRLRVSKLRKEGRVGPGKRGGRRPLDCVNEWTDNDDARLMELYKGGIPPYDDPELLKRHSLTAIIKRCSELRKKGLLKRFARWREPKELKAPKAPKAPKEPKEPKASKKTRSVWTEEDDNRVISLRAKGLYPQKDPELLSRHSAWAILRRHSVLIERGLLEARSNAWTDEENRLVAELLANGEKPQHNAELSARHSQSSILMRASLIRRHGVPSGDKAKGNTSKPVHSIILRSMVSPLQRKAIVGGMFN